MSAADFDSLEDTPARVWLVRGGGVAIVVIVAVGALALGLRSLLGKSTPPARQTAKIEILDLPKPPPPKEPEKIEPPKQEQKVMQVEQPKPQDAPPPDQAPLKMEGAAGDGPSAFQAGTVTKEYDGTPPGPSIGDSRARFTAYGRRLERWIQDEFTRRKLAGTGFRLFLWVGPDGTVQRFQIDAGKATPDAVAAIESALAGLKRASEPPPADMQMPVGLQIAFR